jgi:predicted HicB family RNase H-like nuclease
MSEILSYKGYLGNVKYSAEDEIFHGKLIGVRGCIMYHGKCAASLKKDFIEAVEEYIIFCEEQGIKPEKVYKGSFNVRIEPDLHRRLAIYSASQNKTLNAAVEEAISSYVN